MNATELLLSWYDKNKRDLPWRHTRDPYAVFVSETMLQQTRVDTVIAYYQDFMRQFPDVFALAAAPELDVLNVWKGLGYYSRARNLHRAAQIVAEQMDGRFPATLEGWLALPGVGEYIAGAVMSIALGEPCAAVDGNVLRVIARLDGLTTDISTPTARREVKTRVQGLMPPGRTSDFTQALMELGALVCKPKSPECQSCPVSALCMAYAQDAVERIPVKTPKKPPRNIDMHVAIVACGGAIMMERRQKGALLAGMWGLPAVEIKDGCNSEALLSERYALSLPVGKQIGLARHTFTHQRWEMDICLYEADKPVPAAGNLEWVKMEDIDGKPVPKAFGRALDVYREYCAGGKSNE